MPASTVLASQHSRLDVWRSFSLIQLSVSVSLSPASRRRSFLVVWFRRSLSRPGARVLQLLSRRFPAGRQLSGGGDRVESGLLGAPDDSVAATKSHQVRAPARTFTRAHYWLCLIWWLWLFLSCCLLPFNIIMLSGDCTEAVNRMVSRQSWWTKRWCSSCRVLLQPSYNLVIAATSDLGTVDKKRK